MEVPILRAFTPDDEKALKSAARTYPKTGFYDIEETLTTVGIGEALVTVSSPRGVPTPPVVRPISQPARWSRSSARPSPARWRGR